MTVKNRIAAIRLSNKLEQNKEYATKLGIQIVNGKADDKINSIYKEKNNFFAKER